MLWGTALLLCGAWWAQQHTKAPPLYTPFVVLAVLLCARVCLRHSNAWLVWVYSLLLGFFVGLASVQVRQYSTYTPVIVQPLRDTTLCGVVAAVQNTPHGKRWVLRHLQGEALPTPPPLGVRLVASHNTIYAGDAVCVRADILPLPEPILPNSYDFAQVMQYQSIGGVGRVRALLSNSATTQYGLERFLQGQRNALNTHLRQVVPLQAQRSIITALITGETADIPQQTMEEWRAAGIVHILSVSGLHMAVVVGGTFMVLRWLLIALWPRMALQGRGLALLSISTMSIASAYLLLVGLSAPAVRALLMSGATLAAYVLGGTLPATRTVFLAAALLVLVTPESIADISFQLSFTAVLAVLVGATLLPPPRQRPVWWRYILRLLGDLCWQSLLVTLAMSPLVAFTFNRLSFYGIAANMLAVPLTSIFIMPVLGVALLAWPLHAQTPLIAAAAWGIGLLNNLATHVAQWPYAVLMVLRPHGALVVCTTFCLTLLLLHPRAIKRLFVPAVLLCGACLALPSEPIDAIVAPNASFVLQRLPNGMATFCQTRRNDYLRDRWLARAAVLPANVTLIKQYKSCDLPPFVPHAPLVTQIFFSGRLINP